MTFGVALLLLCDAWRVWMVAMFGTLYVADRATADTLTPAWFALLVIVAVYDTAARRKRRKQ